MGFNLGPIIYFVLGLYALVATAASVAVYFILKRVGRGLKARQASLEVSKTPRMIVGESQSSCAFN